METYSGFAEVYDLFTDNVPYTDWCTGPVGICSVSCTNTAFTMALYWILAVVQVR